MGERTSYTPGTFNGPVYMPQGTIAVLGDSQGAMFAVWTGQYDD
jgi:hypothetical protein